MLKISSSITDEGTDMKTSRKRGRSDGSPTSSAAAVTPSETGHGLRKNPTQTSPSQVSLEVPPRKTRRGATTPDTPQRTSPRGRGGSSPVAKVSALMPRGRGRRSRRGSTDSSASSVGTISVASSSTPTQRRGRRGSSSSGVSATSENSQVTPPTRQTGRGQKRNKSNSPPSVLLKKTNGTSPQYSFRNTKRRKGTAQVGTSLPAANGRNGRRTRGRGCVPEMLPQQDLDGGTDDDKSLHLGDSENSMLQNSSDGLKLAELETPELPSSTSYNVNEVQEGKHEVRKSEIFQNLSDMYDNSEKDHTLQKSEPEKKSEKKSGMCKNKCSDKHHKDDIISDSDQLQPAAVPVAVCVKEYNKNQKDTDISIVPDGEKEGSGKHSGTNIPVSDGENKYSEKHKSISITKSDCENEHHLKLKGTNVPESHGENKHCERHGGTSILVSDNKNEYSGKHQGIIIPILGCEIGHSNIYSNSNISVSINENDKSETYQKSNSPVSEYQGGNMCGIRHDDYVSSSNSIAGELEDVAERQLYTSSDAELRTCNSNTKCGVSDLSTNSSSRVQSAKRRQTSGESFDSESPEVKPKAPKKVKLSDSVPDVTDSLAGESCGKDSVIAKYERNKETGKSDLDRGKCEGSKKVNISKCLRCVKEVVKVEVEMECVSKAEALLASLVLTQEQTNEVCSVIPADVIGKKLWFVYMVHMLSTVHCINSPEIGRAT